MTRFTMIWALAALALSASASASEYAVRLDAGRCVPLAQPELAALGSAWAAFAPFAQRCPVPDPDGRAVLSVYIVRLDQAYAAHLFNGRPELTSPNPELRDAAGRVVGVLPEGFPVDPPGRMRVTFTDWQGGLPRRIELYEARADGASPQSVPPMHWDPEASSYVWPVAPQR